MKEDLKNDRREIWSNKPYVEKSDIERSERELKETKDGNINSLNLRNQKLKL